MEEYPIIYLQNRFKSDKAFIMKHMKMIPDEFKKGVVNKYEKLIGDRFEGRNKANRYLLEQAKYYANNRSES